MLDVTSRRAAKIDEPTKMATVWVVSVDAVNSVWSTKEEAEAYAERCPGAGAPEEFPLRSGLPLPVDYYSALRFYQEGTVPRDTEVDLIHHRAWAEGDHIPAVDSEVNWHPPLAGERTVSVRAWGTDRVLVARVFAEKAAEVVVGIARALDVHRKNLGIKGPDPEQWPDRAST